MNDREQRQAVERIVQIAAVYFPRCTRAELEQAAVEMVRQLAPPSLAYAANAREA